MEQQNIQLKARLFDLQEQLVELNQSNQEKTKALQEIVNILFVQPTEGDNIMLKDIVNAVYEASLKKPEQPVICTETEDAVFEAEPVEPAEDNNMLEDIANAIYKPKAGTKKDNHK